MLTVSHKPFHLNALVTCRRLTIQRRVGLPHRHRPLQARQGSFTFCPFLYLANHSPVPNADFRCRGISWAGTGASRSPGDSSC